MQNIKHHKFALQHFSSLLEFSPHILNPNCGIIFFLHILVLFKFRGFMPCHKDSVVSVRHNLHD